MVKDVRPVENAIVTKANKLIESRYRLSLQEQKIVYSIISLLSPDDEGFSLLRFKVKDLAKFCNINAKNAYRELQEVSRLLLTRVLTIREENRYIQSHWVQSAVYEEGVGVVTFEIDEKLKPYLLGLKREFTELQVADLMKFRSQYSSRIYELLYQHHTFGYRRFMLSDLRVMLGLDKKEYPLYADFRRFILETVVRDLNINTRFEISFETEKKKSKVEYIIFHIKSKPARKDEALGGDLFSEEPVVPTAAPTVSPLMREFTLLLGPDLATEWIDREGDTFCTESYAYMKSRCKNPRAQANYLLKTLRERYVEKKNPALALAKPKPKQTTLAAAPPAPVVAIAEKPDKMADPDCPKCHGDGRYKDLTAPSGRVICSCLK